MLAKAAQPRQGELRGAARVLLGFAHVLARMDAILQFWKNQWTAYPEWLVVSSVAIAGGVTLWLLTRIFAWILKWVLVGAVCLVLVGAFLYFFAG